MKKIIVITVLLLFASCQEDEVSTDDLVESTAELKYNGSFVPTSGITVSGEAKIYLENSEYKVQLENFSITGGPDLKVYLSKSDLPYDFVNLGSLSTQTVYPIPTSVTVSEYTHVLIHCQEYNHLFAIATLTQN
jgi:Electron transfer DM13